MDLASAEATEEHHRGRMEKVALLRKTADAVPDALPPARRIWQAVQTRREP